MAEREEEEWLGELPPYLPGKYKADCFEKGLHRPSDHLKNFNPLDSVYDAEILALTAASFILGFSLAYLIYRYKRQHEAPKNLVFI